MSRADVTQANCTQIFLCVDGHYLVVDGEQVSQPLTGEELIVEIARLVLDADSRMRYMQSPDELVRRMEFRGRRRRERGAS